MMTKKTYKPRETPAPMHAPPHFIERLVSVPVNEFVKMVGRSGLPTTEQRELIAAFKELKG